MSPASPRSCICWAGAALRHGYLPVWSFSPFPWAVWGILKFMSSLGCLNARPDTMGTSWHSERGGCAVFNSHLAGQWGEKWGQKKSRGSFPEEIPDLQVGKGCGGTSQPCSQEAKAMGSLLELEAVSCRGEETRERESPEHLLTAWRDQESAEEQRPPLSPYAQAARRLL